MREITGMAMLAAVIVAALVGIAYMTCPPTPHTS
jgi:hypothetical protein